MFKLGLNIETLNTHGGIAGVLLKHNLAGDKIFSISELIRRKIAITITITVK